MFCTLNDLKKREKAEEQKQASFATGGNSSGLAVRGGPGALNRALQGKLGAGETQEVRITVVMYGNGFTVDGGPLRDYDSPENRRFIEEMNRNRVPAELVPMLRGRKLGINLVDNKGERYEEDVPKPQFQPFLGTGHVVGGSSTPVSTVNLQTPGPYLNPKYPKTTILVRFHSGEKREIEVNETTRVGVIRDYVATAAPVAGDFELVTGYPLTPLQNLRLTVQEAGIANSAVTQRLVGPR